MLGIRKVLFIDGLDAKEKAIIMDILDSTRGPKDRKFAVEKTEEMQGVKRGLTAKRQTLAQYVPSSNLPVKPRKDSAV